MWTRRAAALRGELGARAAALGVRAAPLDPRGSSPVCTAWVAAWRGCCVLVACAALVLHLPAPCAPVCRCRPTPRRFLLRCCFRCRCSRCCRFRCCQHRRRQQRPPPLPLPLPLLPRARRGPSPLCLCCARASCLLLLLPSGLRPAWIIQVLNERAPTASLNNARASRA